MGVRLALAERMPYLSRMIRGRVTLICIFGVLAMACDSGPTTVAPTTPIDVSDTESPDGTEPDSAQLDCTGDGDCDSLNSLCSGALFGCVDGTCQMTAAGEASCVGECETCDEETGNCIPDDDGAACSTDGCVTGRTCSGGVCGGGALDCSTTACAEDPVCYQPNCGAFKLGCGNKHSYSLGGSFANDDHDLYPTCTALGTVLNGPEVKYDFVAPKDLETVTFSLNDLLGQATLLVWRGNACIPDACAASASEADGHSVLVSDVKAGDIFTLVIEAGESGGQTGFTVDVACGADTACVPFCANGATCGGDGCGGQCGAECDEGFVCNEGQCVDEDLPDVCGLAQPIDKVPFKYDGSTAAAGDDYSFSQGACSPGPSTGLGQDGKDVVYSLVPEETGIYSFELLKSGTDFDATLYVALGCDNINGTCLGASNNAGAGGEELSFELTAGEQYFVFVDGAGGGQEGFEGNYSLLVNKPSCTVLADEVVASLPFEGSGSTVSDRWSVGEGNLCGPDTPGYSYGVSAPDYVYSYTADADQTVTLALDPAGTTFDAVLYVSTCLPAQMAGCVAGADAVSDSGEEVLSVSMKAGLTYYIVVDGGNGVTGGAFKLSMGTCVPMCEGKSCGDDGCGGSCGPGCAADSICTAGFTCVSGSDFDTCDSAADVQTVPYTHYGYTEGGTNDYNPPQTGLCADDSFGELSAANDEVVKFTAPGSGTYKFKITDADFDSGLYLITSCTGVLADNCVALGNDNADDGAADVAYHTMDAAAEVYVIVDSATIGKGAYTLSIESCIPNCAGKACGDNGCGGECGVCDGGKLCSADGQCQATVANDTCGTALEITDFNPDQLWVSSLVDTSLANDDYNNDAGSDLPQCAYGGDGVASGAGAPDVVFKFVAPSFGDYEFRLTDQTLYNSALYVVTEDCADVENGLCWGANADGVMGGEFIEATLFQGETLYIIVDGSGVGDQGLAELSILQVF